MGNSVVALLIATGVVTTLFAIGERVLPEKDKAEMNKSVSYVDWNADHLYEDAPSRRISRSETITALIFLVIMALMPVVPSTFFYVGHLNDAGSFVNPELWDGWIPAYFAFLAALMVVEAWKLSAGRWTAPILWTGLLVDAAFAVFLTAAVLTQDVLGPRLFGDAGMPNWVRAVTVAAIWIVTVWDQLTTLRNYRDGGTLDTATSRLAS